jgi:hypothetical protein
MGSLPTSQIYWRVGIKNNQNDWLAVTITTDRLLDLFPKWILFQLS